MTHLPRRVQCARIGDDLLVVGGYLYGSFRQLLEVPDSGVMVSYKPDHRVAMSPGIKRGELVKTLTHVHMELGNIHGKTRVLSEYPAHFLEWVDESVRMLRFQLPSAEIDRLLLTRRYWAIQGAQGFESAKLAQTEIDDRTAALGEAIEWLEATTRKWNAAPGPLVIADSGFFCNHTEKIRGIPFADILELREEPIRLMLPMVVLDGLDGLKQHSNDHVRWRAGHTLGVLDELRDVVEAPHPKHVLPVVRDRVLPLALEPPLLHLAPVVVGAPDGDELQPLLEGGSPRGVVAAE